MATEDTGTGQFITDASKHTLLGGTNLYQIKKEKAPHIKFLPKEMLLK
jgi:hypothetical protein